MQPTPLFKRTRGHAGRVGGQALLWCCANGCCVCARAWMHTCRACWEVSGSAGTVVEGQARPPKAGKVQSSVLLCSYCEDLLCLLGELFCCACCACSSTQSDLDDIGSLLSQEDKPGFLKGSFALEPLVYILIVQTWVSLFSVTLGDGASCKCAPAVGEWNNAIGFPHV